MYEATQFLNASSLHLHLPPVVSAHKPRPKVLRCLIKSKRGARHSQVVQRTGAYSMQVHCHAPQQLHPQPVVPPSWFCPISHIFEPICTCTQTGLVEIGVHLLVQKLSDRRAMTSTCRPQSTKALRRSVTETHGPAARLRAPCANSEEKTNRRSLIVCKSSPHMKENYPVAFAYFETKVLVPPFVFPVSSSWF